MAGCPWGQRIDEAIVPRPAMADLRWPTPRLPDLRGPDLRGPDLQWPDLQWSNPQWSDLQWSDLQSHELPNLATGPAQDPTKLVLDRLGQQ